MEAKPSHTSVSLPQGQMQQYSFQQEPSMTQQPPSQSSQTYTQAPSATGASGQSVTTVMEHVEANQYQAAFSQQHRALSPDQQDFSLAGSWATEPHPDTFVIENEPILSPIDRAGAAVNSARQGTETTDRVGNGNTDDAVGILRASLHREV